MLQVYIPAVGNDGYFCLVTRVRKYSANIIFYSIKKFPLTALW